MWEIISSEQNVIRFQLIKNKIFWLRDIEYNDHKDIMLKRLRNKD